MYTTVFESFYTKHKISQNNGILEILRFGVSTLNNFSDTCAHIPIIGYNITKFLVVWEPKERNLMLS